MPLETAELALIIYMAFMITSLIICYISGSKMIKNTGLFGTQLIFATTLNLFLGICALGGWSMFSWRVNEFLFIGGLVLGVGILAVSEIILIVVLLIRRKKLLHGYHSKISTNG